MIRSTLWLFLLISISGCDRQVNIDSPESVVQSAVVTPSANASAMLPEPVAPVVFDSPVVEASMDAPVDAFIEATPEATPEAPVEAPVEASDSDSLSDSDMSASPMSIVEPPTGAFTTGRVRVAEPPLLALSAGLVEFEPVLVSDDGSRVELICCDADDHWTGEVPLDDQAQWNGLLQWATTVNGEELVVLEAEIQLQAPIDDEVDISPESYDRDLDSDGDGIGNLTELVEGTNADNVLDVSQDFLDASVRIPRVDPLSVPIIDGRAGDYEPGTTRFSGEWANAVQADVDGNRLSIDNLMFASEGFATSAENHHWLAMHDGTWLYVLVIVDDAGLHHFDSREVAKPWRDDSIEVFVDGDNSQLQTYDQVDDFSMHLMMLNSEASGSNSSSDATPNIFRSVNSVALPAGIVFSTGPLQGPSAPAEFASSGTNQDVYEFAIRISDVNIELGRTFGFELQIDDDDDAGDRDSKWGWAHPTGNGDDNDFTWRDPSFMGRAVLLP